MPNQPTCGQPLALVDKLLSQARGSSSAEAAVIVLTEAVGGRLLDAVSLLFEDDTRAKVDWPTTRTTTGYLSGGERRLLAIADGLATGHPLDLADVITGLDSWNAQVVVDAMAHAAGIPRWRYDQ